MDILHHTKHLTHRRCVQTQDMKCILLTSPCMVVQASTFFRNLTPFTDHQVILWIITNFTTMQVLVTLANQSIRKLSNQPIRKHTKANRSPRPTPLSSTSEVPSLYQSSRTSQGSPIQTINHSHLQNQAVQHQHNQNLSTEPVRVVQSRPKPQCWEHGCNGRQFSTFSNLLRHQREKSGVASKSMCPKCGAEFTRTTARNGHMAHEKCKPRNE